MFARVAPSSTPHDPSARIHAFRPPFWHIPAAPTHSTLLQHARAKFMPPLVPVFCSVHSHPCRAHLDLVVNAPSQSLIPAPRSVHITFACPYGPHIHVPDPHSRARPLPKRHPCSPARRPRLTCHLTCATPHPTRRSGSAHADMPRPYSSSACRVPSVVHSSSCPRLVMSRLCRSSVVPACASSARLPSCHARRPCFHVHLAPLVDNTSPAHSSSHDPLGISRPPGRIILLLPKTRSPRYLVLPVPSHP